ncbi:hypothetical protein ACFLRC_03100 [Candidatus Altiarchaeota archaeon]
MVRRGKEKVIAFVPAYNERLYVGHVLEPLVAAKKAGLIEDILVVDGGSNDGTLDEVGDVLGGNIWAASLGPKKKRDSGNLEVKLKHGTAIIHGRNWGKARAFITAARYCQEEGATMMFMTDADLENLSIDAIGRLLKEISKKSGEERHENGPWMASAGVSQRGDARHYDGFCPPEFSGVRVISKEVWELVIGPYNNPKEQRVARTLFPELLSDDIVDPSRGYGLETGLETIVPKDMKSENVFLKYGLSLMSRGRGKGQYNLKQIERGVKRAKKAAEKAKGFRGDEIEDISRPLSKSPKTRRTDKN